MPEADVRDDALAEVILALHQGVFERPHWTSFLEKIRALTGANYASLVFSRADAREGDVTVIRSGGDGQNVERPDMGGLTERLKVPYDALQANRPYRLEDIVDAQDDISRGYTVYLQNRRIDDAIVIRVGGADQGNGWLTLGRDGEGFAKSVPALLTGIAPHLSTAVRTLSELESAEIRANIAHDAVQRLNFGWLTFDAKGNVVEIDPVAERLLAGTQRLRNCARGAPFPIGLSGQRHDLRDILADFASKAQNRARAMHLVDEPWLDMLLVPITYRSLSGGRTPIAVGYVHGVSATSEDRFEQLKQLFGLTGSEARLALAMSQGKTIAEAAAQLNLTVETARNYSKRIYAKTDTRGHADLVRILLASVVALS